MRIGFLGAGGITRTYRRSLRELGAEIVAVVDADPERAAAVASEEGARVWPDYRALLAEAELDAMFVCLPPFAHETQIAEIAERGLAVFVAKPVALTLPVARRALAAIRAAGVVNQVGYMWRSADCVHRALELVGQRPLTLAVGQVLVDCPATAWWRAKDFSGGQIVEQSTHVVDLLRLFLGEIRAVRAVGHTGALAALTDFEDSTVAAFTCESGAVATLASTHTGGMGRYSLTLLGGDLALDIDCAGNRLAGRIDGRTVEYVGQENGYRRQIETFLEAVRSGRRELVPSSYADAARTLAATLAANDALRTGEVEIVDEVE